MEFVVFGLTLLGVALFHRRALTVAFAGFVLTALVRVVSAPAGINAEAYKIIIHLANEWVPLANLFLVLLGFAVLANQFEQSNLPEVIPSRLPGGWAGGVTLLAFVFGLSAFLDNIAGAIIGGVMARHVYRKGVTIGFMAAIVAAANAGGAGSVIGDTTTMMMWIRGVSPLQLAPAFIGAIAAFAFFVPLATFQQQKLSPISRGAVSDVQIDWACVVIVLTILVTIVAVNVVGNTLFPGLEKTAPALGLGLWIAILVTTPFRAPQWRVLFEATRGATFLVVLVALASLIPVDQLPAPSPLSVFGLGLLSAVFDNIPLTALALNQGGYDWALLAYAVGFGGSIVWFGSSAGMALTNLFPEGRSVVQWLRYGWSIAVAYVVGFLVMLAITGWTIAGANEVMRGHDLVMVIGAQVFRYYPYVAGDYLPEGTELLQITSDPGLAGAAPVGESMTPPEVYAALSAVWPVESALVTESTSTMAQQQEWLPTIRSGSFYATASGGIGWGVPAAVGVALGDRAG